MDLDARKDLDILDDHDCDHDYGDRLTAVTQYEDRQTDSSSIICSDAVVDTQEVEVGQQNYDSEGSLCQLAEKGGLTLKGEINMGGQMEITHHHFQDNRTINKEVHHHKGDLHQHTHHHYVKEGDVIHHHGEVHQSHHVHYNDGESGFVQIKDQSELAMVRDENVFVETWAFRAALKQVSDARTLVLSGPASSGKTCTAHAVLRHYKALGYTPLVLHRFEEWRAHVGGGRQQAILLEDIFGKEQFQSSSFLDWVHTFPTVQQLSASGKCVIIITIRDAVLDSIHAEQGTYGLLSHTLDMSSPEACLSEDEKKGILSKHLKRAGKSVSDESFEEAVQCVKNVVLFPARCELFADSQAEEREALSIFVAGVENMYSTCGTGPKVFLWISPEIIKKSLMKPVKKAGQWGHCFTNTRSDIGKHFDEEDWTTRDTRHVQNSAETSDIDGSLSEKEEQEHLSVDGSEHTTDAEHTALRFEAACRDGNSQLVLEMIGSEVEVSYSNKNGFTALHIATLAGQAKIVEILLSCQCPVNAADKEHWTPLHVACCGGHSDIARLLIQHGAKLELATFYGMRPLHIACRYGHTELAQLLLQNGAITEAKPNTGFQVCPLHVAAYYGHAQVVELLIQFRAQTRATDRSGWLPLHYACQEGHLRVVEILLSAVALPSHNAAQSRQLQVSCVHGHNHLVRDLLQCGLCTHDPDGKTAVCRSCFLSNKLALENLSRHHTYPDKPDSGGVGALFLAAQNGHGQVVNSLLKAGACAEARASLGWTPVLVTSYKGHHHILELLLQYKTDVKGSLDHVLWTALHLTSANGHRESVKILLQGGAVPDARDNYGLSPLQRACMNGHSNVVSCLLPQVKEVYSREESATELLCLACKEGCADVVSALHEGIPHIFKITKRSAALHHACKNGNLEIVRTLLNHDFPVNTHYDGNEFRGKTPIHVASSNKHPAVVETLICHGARVDKKKSYGETIYETLFFGNDGSVTMKTSHGDTALHCACRVKCIEVVRVLLEKGGADTQVKNTDGHTCLHIAASEGSVDIVTLLLANSADVNAQDEDGETPLISGRTKNAVVDILLKNQADAGIRTNKDETVLHMVCSCGSEDSLRSLLHHQICLETKDGNGETALFRACRTKRKKKNVIQLLLENEANAEAANNQGTTPVQLACQLGDEELLQQLLQQGGRVNSLNKEGETPLHQACSQGHSHLLETLLQAGAGINDCDREGNTPLHKACANLQTATVKVLLNHGASISAPNKEGLSPKSCLPSLNMSDAKTSDEEKRGKIDNRTEIMLAFLEFNQRFVEKDSLAVGQDSSTKNHENLQQTDSAISGDISRARHSKESTNETDVNKMTETGVEENDREAEPREPEAEKKTPHSAELDGIQESENRTEGKSVPAVDETDEPERDSGGASAVRVEADKLKRTSGELPLSQIAPSIKQHPLNVPGPEIPDSQDSGVHDDLDRPEYAPQVAEAAGGKEQSAVSWPESTSLHHACVQGKTALVLHHLLTSSNVDVRDESGETALHCACSAGQHDLAALLLKHGADPTLRDASGGTCLHKASFHGHLYTVDLLLTQGLDMDVPDKDGKTALHLASRQGHGLVTASLVGRGAEVNKTDNLGNTPLMLASTGSHPEVCVILLNSGADLEQRNKQGESCCDIVKARKFLLLEKMIARHVHALPRPVSAARRKLLCNVWHHPVFPGVVFVVGALLAWVVAACLSGF